jgi:hypothetical protein
MYEARKLHNKGAKLKQRNTQVNHFRLGGTYLFFCANLIARRSTFSPKPAAMQSSGFVTPWK